MAGRTLAAAIRCTTEADALAILLAQPAWATSRLARILRRMERATAEAATRRPNGDRKIAVEDQELLMELGVGQDGLVQGVRPLH